GQIPYRALPALPADVILMPLWFPFNMYNIATWSRTVIAPLLILLAKKPVAANPYKIGVSELFNQNPADGDAHIGVPGRRSQQGGLPQIARPVAARPGRGSLLPALPVADLGHVHSRPRASGGWRRIAGSEGRARLAGAE